MGFETKTCPTCGNVTVDQVCDNCGLPANVGALKAQGADRPVLIICAACQTTPVVLGSVQPRDVPSTP